MMIASHGTMRVARKRLNVAAFAGRRRNAKAYAAKMLVTTCATVMTPACTAEFA